MNELPAPELLRWAALFVKDVGFPVFVAVYLLVRVDPAIRALTKTVHSLSDVMQVAAGLTRRTADPKP